MGCNSSKTQLDFITNQNQSKELQINSIKETQEIHDELKNNNNNIVNSNKISENKCEINSDLRSILMKYFIEISSRKISPAHIQNNKKSDSTIESQDIIVNCDTSNNSISSNTKSSDNNAKLNNDSDLLSIIPKYPRRNSDNYDISKIEKQNKLDDDKNYRLVGSPHNRIIPSLLKKKKEHETYYLVKLPPNPSFNKLKYRNITNSEDFANKSLTDPQSEEKVKIERQNIIEHFSKYYTLGKIIGGGNFGRVYEAERISDSIYYINK